MDQRRMPLVEQLITYKNTAPVSYHVPGHKNGTVFQEEAHRLFNDVLSIDVTEIKGMDDLHHPEGVIGDAEQLAADLYGAEHTSFLVGGSTAGNLAMIVGSFSVNDIVLVQRNSHQSVFHGLEVSGARPVFIEPVIDNETGMLLGADLNAVNDALKLYPEAKGLILTSPTYEGYVQPLELIIKKAHEAGVMVMVDEAHGAHLIEVQRDWPASSLKAGADVVVQSAHKMLPAMTMTAFLHMQGSRVDKAAVKRHLRMFQSSSPSYPLMASLDAARAYLAAFLPDRYERLYKKATDFRKKLGTIPQWDIAPLKIAEFLQDPLKIVLISRSTATGLMLQDSLSSHGIYPELANDNYLVLTLPLSLEWCDTVEKIREAVSHYPIIREKECIAIEALREPVTELSFSYKEMASKETCFHDVQDAAGQVAAEDVVPYPPGIPLIMNGERIKPRQLERLKELIESGASFQTGTAWLHKGLKVYKKD
ncbi:aminotransferase class I/II-fold pyridoxal phosphate-dependent enzyme [Bacillus sp. H-16]|uniref:aminotransferase class I/II-fold pyridoxal phosphate-dependent enzyme n=1 Tax=Alteribacter salitolerans TaxID=2912333 RepID=UPI001965F555|nr:aminotransferase class I/II-fold pyridoxal phosphate-dependent enzyme [Alteribacter salitolerans]MBM7098031.1 aminotransferase class I/II-fold pyridoxal phosphate-dependent enzyme [Alteribacter salitolerans]